MIPWAGGAPRCTTQHNSHYVELCCTHNTPAAPAAPLGPVVPFQAGVKPPAAAPKPLRTQCAGRAGRAARPRCVLSGGHKAAGRLASLASPQLHFDTHL